MTTKWASLPNAQHIDWVLDSLRRDPSRWAAASALIAWDDSSLLLDIPPDAITVVAACGDPRALLLHPAVLVRHGETE